MSRAIVTGGAGHLGRVRAKHLDDLGWDVVALDAQRAELPGIRFMQVDLSNLGSVIEAFSAVDWQYSGGVDAVVNLGAIPATGITTRAEFPGAPGCREPGRVRHPPVHPEGAERPRLAAAVQLAHRRNGSD